MFPPPLLDVTLSLPKREETLVGLTWDLLLMEKRESLVGQVARNLEGLTGIITGEGERNLGMPSSWVLCRA